MFQIKSKKIDFLPIQNAPAFLVRNLFFYALEIFILFLTLKPSLIHLLSYLLDLHLQP